MNCGFDFKWNFFGITKNDTMNLQQMLSTHPLESLTINASGLNDEHCRLLCHALLQSSKLRYLGLLH
jgi:hypothetical protein